MRRAEPPAARLLLLGRGGQVGRELERRLRELGEVHAFNSTELDLTDFSALTGTVRRLKPQVIVNAAAYTAVDRAESEPDRAMRVNGTAPGVLAEAARTVDALLIHFSTDYVFDGRKGAAYVEADAPDPVNLYGRSKLAGEQAVQAAGCRHLILRTSWVYSLQAEGFVTKVLVWARQQPTLRVVEDQVGSPTWAEMLARLTTELLRRGADAVRERQGLYHLAGAGAASRLEWARLILELDPRKHEQVASAVLPARSADFPTPAQRPPFSALDCSGFERSFGIKIPSWQDGLKSAMEA